MCRYYKSNCFHHSSSNYLPDNSVCQELTNVFFLIIVKRKPGGRLCFHRVQVILPGEEVECSISIVLIHYSDQLTVIMVKAVYAPALFKKCPRWTKREICGDQEDVTSTICGRTHAGFLMLYHPQGGSSGITQISWSSSDLLVSMNNFI